MKNIDILFGGKHLSKIVYKILINNDHSKHIYDIKLKNKYFKGNYNFHNTEKKI